MILDTAHESPTTDARPPASRFIRSLALEYEEAREIENLAATACAEYRRVDDESFLLTAKVIAQEFPRNVRQALYEAQLDDRNHALIMSNNLINQVALGSTPMRWEEADTPGSRPAAFMLMLYASLLGDTIGWAAQQQGRLVADIVPSRGDEYSMVSSSSRAMLGWHTEDAFSPSRADHIGLLCLRNPDATPTTISYVTPERLEDRILSVLREPRFLTDPDPSHTHFSGRKPDTVPLPVLIDPLDAPTLRLDRDFTRAVPGDRAAAHALAALVAHLDTNLYGVVLQPGDVCFINNRTVVHGRSPFVPRFDGTDRWLKRSNVVTNLRQTRQDRRTSATRVVG